MQRDWESLESVRKLGLIFWGVLLGLLALWAMWQHCICSPQTTRRHVMEQPDSARPACCALPFRPRDNLTSSPNNLSEVQI
jgi:hypothetical protein